MTENSPETSEYEPAHVIKIRKCLRCSESFESTWTGERVCKRCKGTAEWRSTTGFEAA